MATVRPFRAGHVKGEHAATQPHLMSAHASGAKVLLADISEFQPDINDDAYLQWSKAIVIRAMYGASHVDHAWRGGGRRDALHAGGARFTGIYQYVVAGQDPITQAAALIELLGPLRQGEVIIGDFEEGSGSMAQTRRLWSSTIAGATGDAPWDYSGLFFAREHGLQPVRWLAAYQSAEPGTPHTLWQFTDHFNVPGVGHADCSVFHGTIGQLAGLAHQVKPKPAPHPAPAPAPATWRTEGMMTLAALAAAHLHEPVSEVLTRTVQASPGHVLAANLAAHVNTVFAADTTHCPPGSTWYYPTAKGTAEWTARGMLSLSALAGDLGTTAAVMIALTIQHGGLKPLNSGYINTVFAATPIHVPAGCVLYYGTA